VSVSVFNRHLDNAIITRFNLWSALKGSDTVGLDDHCRSLPTELFCSLKNPGLAFSSLISFCIGLKK